MKTSALWFGIVAIALAVSPAHAQKSVDWSQYIDKRAVANANAPTNPASDPVAEPAPKKSKKVAKATKAKKAKTKARAGKKARRK